MKKQEKKEEGHKSPQLIDPAFCKKTKLFFILFFLKKETFFSTKEKQKTGDMGQGTKKTL
jgi:hypothetical protein